MCVVNSRSVIRQVEERAVITELCAVPICAAVETICGNGQVFNETSQSTWPGRSLRRICRCINPANCPALTTIPILRGVRIARHDRIDTRAKRMRRRIPGHMPVERVVEPV